MSTDPLDLKPTPTRIWVLFKEKILPETAWERANDYAGFTPSPHDWRRFLDRLLLTLGVIFVVAGVVFFFAFNWADLPRFGKFAVVQAATLIATVLAFWLRLETWGGRLALGAAAMFIGVTLAVAGQAYQTGADSYRLFMIWWLIITPWVLLSRWNVMWLMWVILANTTLSLYWWQIVGTNQDMLNLVMALVNFAFIVGWDIIAQRGPFPFMRDGDWFLYLIAVPAYSYATVLMLDYVFEFGWEYVTLGPIAPIIYLLIIGVTIAFYTTVKRDLPMLTFASLSVLVVFVGWLGERLFTIASDDTWYFISCFMGMLVIGLTAGLAFGLRTLQKAWRIEA
jgi:uncharacterized membrane protein